jgi:tetratricopeptide (TPR) repeat protein
MKKIRIIAAIMVAVLLMGCGTNLKDGVALLEEEKYEEAIACFELEIEEGKHLLEAYRGIAIAQFELGNFESAIEYFEMLLADKEAVETASVYMMKAASHLQLEQSEEALAAYQKALTLELTDEMKQEVLFNEIAIYQTFGDWDTVKEKVAAYVESYPDDARMDKTVEFLETR